MRDPRNVVISEYMMRTQVIERERWTRKFSLDEFIMWKFEVSRGIAGVVVTEKVGSRFAQTSAQFDCS